MSDEASTIEKMISIPFTVNAVFEIVYLVIGFMNYTTLSIINTILYIISMVIIVCGNKIKLIKKEYIEDVNKLHGLYKYLNEYSIIREQEIKYKKIYNDYFLYAASMGIADKFEKEFNQSKLDNNLKTNLQIFIDRKD